MIDKVPLLKWFLSKEEGLRHRLQLLLALSVFLFAYLYLWVYQSFWGFTLTFSDFYNLLKSSLAVAVVLLLIYYVLCEADPLQHSRFRWRSVQFFQAQFPSNYIRDRCQRCVQTPASCTNFINPASSEHVNYWLNDIWRGVLEKEQPQLFEKTFERGYTCKLVLGVELALGFLGALAVSTLVAWSAHVAAARPPKGWAYTSFHFLYPAACFFFVWLIDVFNKPEMASPTGCWKAWQEINRGHVLWMRHNEQLLVQKVCQAGGNTKAFQEKPPKT